VSIPTGPDPIDRLHAADPIRTDDVPDASLARVAARIQEHIMTDKQHDPTVRHPRGPLAWVGGLAAVGVIALAFAIALGNGFGAPTPPPVAVVPTPSAVVPTQSEAPVDPGNPAAGGGVASCLVYDPANLPNFDTVFDGSVTAIDADQVTFKVNNGWKGADGSVTLTAPQVDIAISGPQPDFTVGGRYLVTASGSTISACGYTLDYDADTAATWAAVFGS
jgi:hypothetical protein